MPNVKLTAELAAIGNNVVTGFASFRDFDVCEVNGRVASFSSTSAASDGSFARHEDFRRFPERIDTLNVRHSSLI